MGERFRESAEASWLLEAPDTGELLRLLIVCLFFGPNMSIFGTNTSIFYIGYTF
jgi:hypothetical protein